MGAKWLVLLGNDETSIFSTTEFLILGPLAAATKPNIVIICDDDFGFADIGVNGSKLIRMGAKSKKGKEKVRYELYHLAEDIGEQRNVLTQYPKRADTMKALLDAFYNGQPASEASATK